MNDPYEILGVVRDASDDEIRAAYKKHAKANHPDAGGNDEAFVRGQTAQDLLLDPVRRKVFDATGYDPQLAEPAELQGLMVIEKLVNDIVLDEREPGSFDPLARMRAKLAEDIRKARFHISEMEGHSARIEKHIARLGMKPGTDVLGYMLRARIAAITKVIDETAKQIAASTRAADMLESYTYALDEPRGATDAVAIQPAARVARSDMR